MGNSSKIFPSVLDLLSCFSDTIEIQSSKTIFNKKTIASENITFEFEVVSLSSDFLFLPISRLTIASEI